MGIAISAEGVASRRLSVPVVSSSKSASYVYLQGYQVPATYTKVLQYLERMQQRDSWKATYYAPEIVVAGWSKH